MNALVMWPIYELCFHIKERFMWPASVHGATKARSPPRSNASAVETFQAPTRRRFYGLCILIVFIMVDTSFNSTTEARD